MKEEDQSVRNLYSEPLRFTVHAEPLPDNAAACEDLLRRIANAVNKATMDGLTYQRFYFITFENERDGDRMVPLEKPFTQIHFLAADGVPNSAIILQSPFPAIKEGDPDLRKPFQSQLAIPRP